MHRLARHVRFSINPFLPEEGTGFNSYASRPPGEGLSLFLELCVELVGEVEPATGFVVNVLDIDQAVRQFVVPLFGRRIRADFRERRHIGFPGVVELLKSGWGQLADKFGTAGLSRLSLALNPFSKIAIDGEDCKMIYYSEKFEFAAMHKLWNEDFSAERNVEVFGKCANPAGHGHNYVVEVTVRARQGGSDFRAGGFEKIVDDEFIKLVDHKNLNVDVAELGKSNPTVENITFLAWQRLAGKFGEASLHCVTVWETDKTYCSYYGA
ncbi:MAG TPA: 6-carboxytetrahydropterin synthase [Sedimentisphaerales bacterium]|nr:6-carboxytetrahydropterin synthase [Sedimentisphaerales bacterium]